jgi:tetratricopeptide (TPR) repeat protein
VIEFFTNEMVLAKINSTVDTLTRNKYRVTAFPTMVMLSPDGREIDRVVGYMEAGKFLTTMRDYKQGIGTLADLRGQAEKNPTQDLAFRVAEKYKYRSDHAPAAEWFEKAISLGQPKDSMTWECRMSLADMYRRAKNYDRSITEFESIMTDFTGTKFAIDAEIWRAFILDQKGDTASAIEAYKAFIEHHPEAEDVEFANKQIAKLNGSKTVTK